MQNNIYIVLILAIYANPMQVLKTIFLLLLISFPMSIQAQEDSLDYFIKKSFLHRSHPDSGLYYANKAFLLSSELNDEQGIVKSKLYAGLANTNLRKNDTALYLLHNALRELKGSSFEKGMASWYLGKIHLRTRSFQRAEVNFIEAIPLFKKADSTLFISDVYSSLGVTQGMQNNYTQALDWFTKSYELKVRIGREKETAADLTNIALVYTRMKSYQKALKYVWLSINLQDNDDDYTAYSTLGGTYNLMGNIDSAFLYYRKSLEIALENNHSHQLANAYANLSNISYQKENYSQAISWQKRALKLCNQSNNGCSLLFTQLGQAYLSLDIIDSASYYLKKGHQLAKLDKNKLAAKNSSQYLGKLYEEENQFDSAYFYSLIRQQYADSINNEEIQEVFSNQRVQLETLKKQLEIEDLTRQKEKISNNQRLVIIVTTFVFILGIVGFISYRNRQVLANKRLKDKNIQLRADLVKNRNLLSAHTLSMIHRKNGFEEIENELKSLNEPVGHKIKSIININKALEKDWDNFQTYFAQVHSQFYTSLRKQFPDLSQSEERLSALIKMNLANREIASLLNIESKSVKMARYRLRKKLSISEETDLNIFVQSID